MKTLQGTCTQCENGQIGFMVCPCCWGTTVSPAALAEARSKLEELRQDYADRKKEVAKLKGAARGRGGQTLATIGATGRVLKEEIAQIDNQINLNKAVARIVGAAAN